jgi:hypothetical protein
MRKTFSIAAITIVAALTASSAQAFPVESNATSSNEIIEVRQLCGLGWHRGPWGGCRPNGYRYAYRPYAYAAPYAGCWWRPSPWGPARVCNW